MSVSLVYDSDLTRVDWQRLSDLIVHPEFQGKGIGSSILAYLKDSLEGYIFTTLTTAVGKESFYEQQGWKKQTTSYIWPRSAKQEQNNT